MFMPHLLVDDSSIHVCCLHLNVGVDGCFIKLNTGAQILAATGRDGNNNIFPLAFAIVGQEDIANWCWFLHQLKICLGGEVGKFGPYTIMSDRQKVCISLFIFMHISYVVDSSFSTPVA